MGVKDRYSSYGEMAVPGDSYDGFDHPSLLSR